MPIEKRTVGILGASADPPHEGHMQVALNAREVLGLDEVWFMVTPHSPVKIGRTVTPVEYRLHMTYLAARETGQLGDRLKVSEFEVLLRKFDHENATINMLTHFSEAYPHLAPVWLMGADNFAEIHTWGGQWNRILEEYPVGVFSRPKYLKKLRASFAAKAFADRRLHAEHFTATPGTWSVVEDIAHPASSTKIREQIQAGHANPKYLPPSVLEFIREQRLYGYRDAYEFS